jgi:nitroreductase
MPDPSPATLDFLLTRRSRPARTLGLPVPDRDRLTRLLTAAARVPDHGKLTPWRFIVLEKPALTRLSGLVAARAAALHIDPDKRDKSVAQYRDADLAVVVVQSPGPTDRIPLIEQTYSAGAVCLTLLQAALADGWGANWLSGWPIYDRTFLTEGLALAPHETVAGIIHVGTEVAPSSDRPRPDPATLTTWVSA